MIDDRQGELWAPHALRVAEAEWSQDRRKLAAVGALAGPPGRQRHGRGLRGVP